MKMNALAVLGIVAAALVVVVVAVVALGAATPKRHTARVSAHMASSPSVVWPRVTDLATWPSWNPSAREVVRINDVNGHPAFRVSDAHNDAIPYEIVAAGDTRMITRIVDDGLPFGGTWTWTIAAASDGGSDVTIVEDGLIKNVIFRALSRTVFGYTTTQKKALTALGGTITSESSEHTPD